MLAREIDKKHQNC